MAHRLIVTRRAEREAGEAHEWYEEQVPGLGSDFLAALDEQLILIEESPLLYAEAFRDCAVPFSHAFLSVFSSPRRVRSPQSSP